MLIEIDAGIADKLNSLQHNPRFRDAMTNLALSYREGKHVIIAPRSVLDQLMHLDALDQLTQRTFQLIKGRYQDGQNLRKQVRYFVRVYADSEWVNGTSLITESAGRACFRVPYHFFDDSLRIQVSRLVAEDSEDATFYERVASAYLVHKKEKVLRGVKIRCSLKGGGGSRTASELRLSAKEGFVLCIVDSDRDWHGDGVGETARKALQAGEDLKKDDAVAHVFVLPCRHVENLLPGALVMDALPRDADPGFRSRCERARQVGVLGGEELFHYLHVKKGLSLCDVFSPQPKERQEYLRAICQRLAKPAPFWCQDICERDAGRRQLCNVFEGLGDQLFRHVVEHVGDLSPHKLAEYLFSQQQQSGCGPIWAELGEVLLSWTCAFKPLRA